MLSLNTGIFSKTIPILQINFQNNKYIYWYVDQQLNDQCYILTKELVLGFDQSRHWDLTRELALGFDRSWRWDLTREPALGFDQSASIGKQQKK